MRTTPALLIALAIVVVPPAAAAAPVAVKLTTSTPTPVVDQPWRYTLTVKSSTGAPLRARVKLQLLVGQTVVGCWKGGEMAQCFDPAAGSWIAFRGKRTGVLRFPLQSVGVKLTFRATVVANGQTRRVRAFVTVRPKPPPPVP